VNFPMYIVVLMMDMRFEKVRNVENVNKFHELKLIVVVEALWWRVMKCRDNFYLAIKEEIKLPLCRFSVVKFKI
jgi:hypothetical protein